MKEFLARFSKDGNIHLLWLLGAITKKTSNK
jgi:hypothetical protein